MTRGVCLCGAIRYEFTEPFHAMVHCHCSMCRKHHGAPFATFAVAALESFRWLRGSTRSPGTVPPSKVNAGSAPHADRWGRCFCPTTVS